VVYQDDPKTKKLVEDQKTKLDLLTRLLCFVLTNATDSFWLTLSKVKKTAAHGDAFKELSVWWEQHKADDKRERKKIRQAALAKLSPEEKEALGLD
jgi:hypothetical protein